MDINVKMPWSKKTNVKAEEFAETQAVKTSNFNTKVRVLTKSALKIGALCVGGVVIATLADHAGAARAHVYVKSQELAMQEASK